jgi:hypothetical protein
LNLGILLCQNNMSIASEIAISFYDNIILLGSEGLLAIDGKYAWLYQITSREVPSSLWHNSLVMIKVNDAGGKPRTKPPKPKSDIFHLLDTAARTRSKEK